MLPSRLVMLSISYTLPGTADIITVIIIFIQLILHPSLRKAGILKHPQWIFKILSRYIKAKDGFILILDACRSYFGLSKGYYSEITATEDVFIAYVTQFQYTSICIANQMKSIYPGYLWWDIKTKHWCRWVIYTSTQKCVFQISNLNPCQC